MNSMKQEIKEIHIIQNKDNTYKVYGNIMVEGVEYELNIPRTLAPIVEMSTEYYGMPYIKCSCTGKINFNVLANSINDEFFNLKQLKPKEVTLEEIEKKLGYKVSIISK